MKTNRLFIITMLLSMFFINARAQDMMQSIFDPKGEITWFGLDFTGAKLIGDREKLGSTSDVQRLMENWNTLMVDQKDKFNIATTFDKSRDKVITSVEVTKEHNANIDVTELFSNQSKDLGHLKPDDIIGIIADYDFKGATGLGLMFNVDTFSKLDEKAVVWITFINLNTKEVLFSEKMTGEPGGIGLRNYWAGGIYDILNKMKRKEFEMWRKKYYRK